MKTCAFLRHTRFDLRSSFRFTDLKQQPSRPALVKILIIFLDKTEVCLSLEMNLTMFING